MKLYLTGLDDIDKELILKMKPVASDSTIQPMHQFIQCYNGNKFFLLLFAAKTLGNKTYCHFNGTEKRTETLHFPKKFYVDGKLFSYHNQKWVEGEQQTEQFLTREEGVVKKSF